MIAHGDDEKALIKPTMLSCLSENINLASLTKQFQLAVLREAFSSQQSHYCIPFVYRVYKKKRNLGISQEIDIVLKTKDFRRLGI